ncbi:MAG: hypothetical protein LBK72_07260 [Bifidobacteriaceae bacterium]|nr:hypothetical protein [Bifidobacteriaceae bacterium]
MPPSHAAAPDRAWRRAIPFSLSARRDAWTALIIAAVGSVIAFGRLPGLVRGTVWAEDGALFLPEFLADGWATVFRSYSGYLHVGPRVITGVAASVAGVDLFAVAMTGVTCVIAGLCGGVAFLATRGVLVHLAPRIMVAAIPVAAPLLPVEVLGNATNVHWLGLWLTPWLMVCRPRRWSVSLGLAAVVLVAALSEIEVVAFLPLIALTWRHRKSVPINAALVLGVLAQVATTLAYPRVRQPSDVRLTLVDLLDSTLAQTVLGAYTGDTRAVGESLASHGLLAGWAGLAPFVCAGIVAVIVAVRRWPGGARRRRWVTALGVCVLAAGCLFAAAAIMNPGPRFAMTSLDAQGLRDFLFSRYAVAPSMFALAIPAFTTDALLARRTRGISGPSRAGAARIAAVIVIALVLLVEVVSLRPAWTRRSDGPGWSSGVTAARESCATPGTQEVTIPLAPKGWLATIPCAHLRG